MSLISVRSQLFVCSVGSELRKRKGSSEDVEPQNEENILVSLSVVEQGCQLGLFSHFLKLAKYFEQQNSRLSC